MSFPGLQHTQEIGSVIVYVSVENVATVSFFRLSAGPYFTPSLAEKQNRAPHCWVSVSAHCFRTANRSQSWLGAAGGHMDRVGPKNMNTLQLNLHQTISVISSYFWCCTPLDHVLLLDWHRKYKAWFILKVQLKQNAKTHWTSQHDVPFKQRFS